MATAQVREHGEWDEDGIDDLTVVIPVCGEDERVVATLAREHGPIEVEYGESEYRVSLRGDPMVVHGTIESMMAVTF